MVMKVPPHDPECRPVPTMYEKYGEDCPEEFRTMRIGIGCVEGCPHLTAILEWGRQVVRERRGQREWQ